MNKEIKIIYKSVGEVKPYEKNPRKNEEAVPAVMESIKQFGFKVPIVIDKDGIIVTGHTRLKAAKRLGLKEVPTIIADDLSEEQIKAFRLADNKVSEIAEWDFDLLGEELGDILSIDMNLLGFDLEEEKTSEDVEEDNFEVQLPEEPKSKLGQVYQLGKHRLMCGDSTNPEDVAKLMDEKVADLLITDPPYNVDIGIVDIEEAKIRKRRTDGLSIKNDKMGDSEFHIFLVNTFTNAYNNLKSGGSYYIWYASKEVVNFQTSLEESKLPVKQELIWNKNSLVMGRQDYQWKHEPCLYGWKEGAAHYFTIDRTKTTVIEDKQDFNKMKKEELVNLLEEIYSDKVPTTIINENRPSTSELHPTMKPIKLIAKIMENSSVKDNIVLDLFGGSGTTLITAEQLGRTCYMMELDPKYVDVIIDRWEQYTGGKAVLLDKNNE